MVESTQQKPKNVKPLDLTKKYKRKECEDLLKRKFFYVPSFEIYGGVSGLYDYGPLGCALKSNVEQLWRQHFVLEEDMLEVGCSSMTLADVLQTSGHVEKFADFMVKDMKTGNCRRADKLIEEHIQKILPKKKKAEEIAELEKILIEVENYEAEQLDEVIENLKIKDPETGNPMSKAVPFNLMFAADIGPTGHLKGYLRPETAQGIFINFRRLIEYNNGRMPFASAQIGLGFRNEIHPKQGLLRVREFTMAEIEHFFDPQNNTHPKFNEVADIVLPLWAAKEQEANSKELTHISLGEAVKTNLIKSETLAYFMGRSYSFLTSVGIRSDAIRFRQHRSNEMAHYANDCWDAEVETSYGWIEIAGHSDRSAFDLERHANKTKVDLCAARPLKEQIKVQVTNIVLNRQVIGKGFKRDSKMVCEYLEGLKDEEIKLKMMQEFEASEQKITIKPTEGKEFELTKDHISFTQTEHTKMEEKFTPHVIEPSFGIGRIIYCIFEHCFKVREEDAQRTFFDFPPHIAPLKCSLLPLMSNPDMNKKVSEIKRKLIREGVTSKVDDSGQSVGKRYARTDECGIPFAITVDFDTLQDDTVTVRDLDSMKQVRMHSDEVAQTLIDLTNGKLKWAQVVEKYGLFTAAESK